MKDLKTKAFINSLLTSLYIIGIGAFFYYAGTIKLGKANAFLAPIAMLFLLVFSAALTGYLIVGNPIQMYIDGKKKDALEMLKYTLLFLAGFTLVALILLFTTAR